MRSCMLCVPNNILGMSSIQVFSELPIAKCTFWLQKTPQPHELHEMAQITSNLVYAQWHLNFVLTDTKPKKGGLGHVIM